MSGKREMAEKIYSFNPSYGGPPGPREWAIRAAKYVIAREKVLIAKIRKYGGHRECALNKYWSEGPWIDEKTLEPLGPPECSCGFSDLEKSIGRED